MSSIPHPHCWNKIMGGLLRDPQTCVLLADPCSVILGPFERLGSGCRGGGREAQHPRASWSYRLG